MEPLNEVMIPNPETVAEIHIRMNKPGQSAARQFNPDLFSDPFKRNAYINAFATQQALIEKGISPSELDTNIDPQTKSKLEDRKRQLVNGLRLIDGPYWDSHPEESKEPQDK